MLKLHTGSDIKVLAHCLLSELKEQPLSNPLVPELFIVQNYGMARWLSLYIAEKEGIAANMQFKFPAEIFWKIIRSIQPKIPKNLPSERLPMTWTTFQILQTDHDPSLAALHGYVQNEDPGKQEMRTWQLACRIGDVLDQYLTYRPEMLLGWEKEGLQLTFEDSSAGWQAALWRKLNSRWQSQPEEWTHRASIQQRIFNKIDQENIQQEKIPQRISIFGVTEMPPIYTRLFLKVSKYTDVHIYLADFSSKKDNALIRSLGQDSREFRSVIDDIVRNDQAITCEEQSADISHKIKRPTLFGGFKADLLGIEHESPHISIDDTIQIHSCHSTRREVEILYDQLLHIFDEHPDINPSDILVLSPEMEAYAPDVHAVFGAVENGVPEIPFNVSAGSEAREVNVSFLKILQLIDGRFKVTEVLDLLDFTPIREAFSFTEDDTLTLEKWIKDTRIRWGIDASHKQSFDVPPSKSFTWQAGIHRMLSGYGMAPRNDSLFEEIYPYDEIQQLDHADLLGRFSQFLHHLYRSHRKAQKAQTPQQWSALLNDWLDTFYTDDDLVAYQIQSLRKIINSLHDTTQNAGYDDPVHFQIIRSYIKDQLEQQQTGGGRRGPGVTFSSFIPMRNIPAKVVALIGMNDGVFPRSTNSVSFDIMAKNPRAGDRVQANVDRQLFLEALMAAEELLYVSYIGQSNKKDIEFPPSVLVKEMVNYLDDKYKININKVIKHHRLHAFSIKYFDNSDESLFSYSKTNRDIARRLYTSESEPPSFFTGSLPEPDPVFKTISINDLVAFFQHPARFLMNNRLGIYLRDDSIIDEDRETFDLDALEKYNLGQEMLNRLLNGQSLESYHNVAEAKDLLPEGWPGQNEFERSKKGVEEFGGRVEELFNQQKKELQEVHYNNADITVTGQLDTVYEHAQLFYRFGGLRPKDRLALWIKHLLFQTVKHDDHSGESLFIARDQKNSVEICRLAPVVEPDTILDQLLATYWRGLQNRVLFFPKTSFVYAEAIIKKEKNEEEALKAARKRWDDEWNDFDEKSDAYNKLYIGSSNLFKENKLRDLFKKISKVIWSPFFDSLNTAKEARK